jgi:hypothetical protein
MDMKVLVREIEQARRQANEQGEAAEAAAARARMSRQRLELLEQLLETERALARPNGELALAPHHSSQKDGVDASDRVRIEPIAAAAAGRPRWRRGQAAVLVEAAKAALGKAHKPLHISELRASIERAGISIPGQGLDANLIVHLRKSDEIVRVERGFYALAEWNLQGTARARARKAGRR